MHERDYEPHTTAATSDSQGIGALSLFELLLRWATRLLGFALIVIGLYGTINVFWAVGQAVRDPKTLVPAVASMVELMNFEALEFTINGEKLVLGRSAAVVVLLLWYVVWAWLALAVLGTGARLVFAVLKERREFLAAMKEFILAARLGGMSGGPTKPK